MSADDFNVHHKLPTMIKEFRGEKTDNIRKYAAQNQSGPEKVLLKDLKPPTAFGPAQCCEKGYYQFSYM